MLLGGVTVNCDRRHKAGFVVEIGDIPKNAILIRYARNVVLTRGPFMNVTLLDDTILLG